MAGESKALVKKEGKNRKERRANEKSKVDNTHRRTWDKEDYEERAAARDKVAVPAWSFCLAESRGHSSP